MKSLVSFLLLAAFIMLGAENSLACTCAPVGAAAEELERAAAVFSGKVVEIKRHKQSGDLFAEVEVVFRVERAWKGADGRTVSVFTSSHSAACGYGFRTGRTYLVYAHGGADGRLSAGICSRTKRLKDAREDLNALGAGRDVVGGASRVGP